MVLNDSKLEDVDLMLNESVWIGKFSIWYQGRHGYLSIVVCLFGIVSNAVNIAVLTRRSMSSPANCLLTSLAVTDLLTMMSYLPFAAYFYCYSRPHWGHGHQRAWIVYLLFNNNFIITSHTASVWLTVSLAIFRYVVVCYPSQGPTLCSSYRAKVTIVAVFATTVVSCIPNYVLYRPISLDDTATGAFWFKESLFVTEVHLTINYWLFGVVMKIVPCVLLTLLSCLLVQAMRKADVRRQRLKGQSTTRDGRTSTTSTDADGDSQRTTRLLLAIVICFVSVELPQGVLAFLSAVDSDIFYGVYVPLGDVWDLMVLVNSAVNFPLYCVMSRQFRRTFYGMFFSRNYGQTGH